MEISLKYGARLSPNMKRVNFSTFTNYFWDKWGLMENLGTKFGGEGGNPIFPIPISAKSTFISGKSGNSFSPISPSLITLGHMFDVAS